jgi:hypothetical protein
MLARYHLARVLFMLGRTGAARVQLEDFLTRWGSADHRVPEVDDARRLIAAIERTH